MILRSKVTTDPEHEMEELVGIATLIASDVFDVFILLREITPRCSPEWAAAPVQIQQIRRLLSQYGVDTARSNWRPGNARAVSVGAQPPV